MKKAVGTHIKIKLVVGKMIPLFSDKEAVAALCQKLSLVVIEYLSQVGVKGSPIVTLQRAKTKENGPVMQVFVHGVHQPYSPETMRRVWQYHSPLHLHNLPDRDKFSYHFPDGWLNEFLLNLDLADKQAINHSLDFLADLAFTALKEKPSFLLSKHQVIQYIGIPYESFQVNMDFITNVLTFLLDHGVSMADTHTILGSILQNYKLGRSSEETSELLFARLRGPNIEIIVSPEEFRSLTGCKQIHKVISVYSDEVSKESRNLMNTMEEELYWDMGLYLPDLVWRIDPDMPPGNINFKMNDQTLQRLKLLSKDELLVNDTPDRMRLLDVTPATLNENPANGKPCSIVSVAHKSLLENAGLTTWDPLSYVVLVTTGEIKRRATHLFTVDDATHHLAQIRQYFPVLTDKILKRFSIENLTRIMRALLAERISIRDQRSILERMLQYGTVTVDSYKFIVFDERLPIAPSSKVLHPESWQSYYEFLRSGLKRQITSILLKGQSTIPVYLLDKELEQWLMTENISINENAEDLEVKRHAIRQAIWAEIGTSYRQKPIILTTIEARVSLLEITNREIPNIFITSYSEITPDASLQPISRILLPETCRKT